jgi:hypothetical protein
MPDANNPKQSHDKGLSPNLVDKDRDLRLASIMVLVATNQPQIGGNRVG